MEVTPAPPPRTPGVHLVHSPHPLLPAAERRRLLLAFQPGEALGAYLARAGVDTGGPLVVAVNDRVLAREQWAQARLAPGDVVVVRGALEKGSAGLLLSIGLSAIAPGLGTALGSAVGLSGPAFSVFGQAVTWGHIFGGVISIAGNLLISGLTAAPQAQLGQLGGRNQAASPTYSLAGGANRARPFEPLPLVLGRHRMFPDLAAAPYTEFVGEDQYLHQAFNFGLSDIALSDYRIGQSPITSYQGLTLQESGADGALTLFPGNVDSAQGAGLEAGGAPVTRTTSPNAVGIAVEVTGIAYTISNDTGDVNGAEMHLRGEYRALDGAWLGLFPGGASSIVIVHADKAPYRRGWFVSVPEGQYEVRLQLVQAVRWGPIAGNTSYTLVTQDHQWTQLRTYQPDTADYTGQRRVALRVRATAQLNGQIEALSALATARCEAWTGSAWVTQATRNPAWWFRWFALGKFDADGRRLFGAGLPAGRIDEAAIKDWGAWCDAKGLACDLVIDRAMSVVEVLRAIARCGRGVDTWATGRLGAVWDEAELPVTQVFGMGNIRAGSFRVEYLSAKLPDEIIATFVNADNDWQQDTLRVTVPGVVNPENPATVDLWGTTNAALAAREANLLAARQAYQPRRVSWETDHEGLVCARGDVVSVSHDMTQWGASGRLVSGTTSALVLSREVTFEPGVDNVLLLRHPDGTQTLHVASYSATATASVTITPALDAAPDAGDARDWLWLFAPTPTPGKRLKLLDWVPVDERHVRLVAQDDPDEYYLAEFNPYEHTPVTGASRLPVLSNLAVHERLRLSGSTVVNEVVVSWDVSGEYGGAVVRAALNGAELAERARVLGRRAELAMPLEGALLVEVTAFDLRGRFGAASRATLAYTLQGGLLPPGDVPWFSADGRTLSWGAVGDVDVVGYRLRWQRGENVSWGDAEPLHDGLVTASPWTPERLPTGTATLMVKAVDSSGVESVQPAVIVAALGDAIVANIVETLDEHDDGFLGTITGGTVNGGSGNLEANDASGAMWRSAPAAAMWAADATAAMWSATVYETLSYEWTASPTEAQAGGTMTLSYTIAGDGQRIDYRRQGPNAMWGSAGDDMWQTDDDSPMWSAAGAPAWQPWPGQVAALAEPFDFRLTVLGGALRPVVSALAVVLDVPDILEHHDDVAIASGGARVAPTASFRVIRNVSLTLQDDAGSARTARVLDKNASLGPLVQCFDAAGSGTAGTLDVTIQGY